MACLVLEEWCNDFIVKGSLQFFFYLHRPVHRNRLNGKLNLNFLRLCQFRQSKPIKSPHHIFVLRSERRVGRLLASSDFLLCYVSCPVIHAFCSAIRGLLFQLNYDLATGCGSASISPVLVAPY